MEKISALMDGELDARLGDQQFAHLKNDSGARACWDTYHLIGDALRGERVVSGNPSGRLERFSALLAQEPTVLAPHRRPAKPITAYAWPVAASPWVISTTVSKPCNCPRNLSTWFWFIGPSCMSSSGYD